jgi:dTDP-4-dehydrorhamnose reductase
MMRILVTGAGGLLGSTFTALLGDRVVATLGRAQLDATKPEAVAASITAPAPDIVINCAAHTDLEAAERDPAADWLANAQLPGLVADACQRVGARFVHFSSTGCYGAWRSTPYVEEDELRPTTAHHRAKVAGEQRITAVGGDWLVLRTGWLYGGDAGQPKNFVWKRLAEAVSKDELMSDATQRGCPTHAVDVANQTIALLEANARGTFNVVAQGNASRFEYVDRIVRAGRLACKVRPGPAFARLAPVSPNEMAFDNRLEATGLLTMPNWGEALDAYVGQLTATPLWAELVARAPRPEA